ncbi:MAG: response regulator [Sandaracinus sp.]|jgi:DNA-binding NtrC family response regulator
MSTNVLFVDDEPQVLSALRQALRKSGLRIETAPSGEAALERLARGPVDVVVSDERMPGTQGSELLALVRAADPHTIRILLTGQASVEAAVRAVNDAAVHRFLTKPCPPNVLLATIRELIEQRDAEAAKAAHAAAPAPPEERERSRAEIRIDELEALELEHPGIGAVERTPDGVIILQE